jgi:DNA ligase (NAD+)
MVLLLKEMEPDHSFFKPVANQNAYTLPSLINSSFIEWYLNFKSEYGEPSVVIQPKIDGVAIACRYENGRLVKAWSRKGDDKTYCMRMIENLPKEIDSGFGVFEVRGELFGAGGVAPAESQRLAAGHLRKKAPNGKGLAFCAFEILDGFEGSEEESLGKLVELGFTIPTSLFVTAQVIDKVKDCFNEWEDSRVFENVPTDGIVVKIAEKEVRDRLPKSGSYPNWAIAVKLWQPIY